MELGEVCDLCNLTATEEAPGGIASYCRPMAIDPCLGKLPGVLAACCGHGTKTGYITWGTAAEDESAVTIRFANVRIEHKKIGVIEGDLGFDFDTETAYGADIKDLIDFVSYN